MVGLGETTQSDPVERKKGYPHPSVFEKFHKSVFFTKMWRSYMLFIQERILSLNVLFNKDIEML